MDFAITHSTALCGLALKVSGTRGKNNVTYSIPIIFLLLTHVIRIGWSGRDCQLGGNLFRDVYRQKNICGRRVLGKFSSTSETKPRSSSVPPTRGTTRTPRVPWTENLESQMWPQLGPHQSKRSKKWPKKWP